MLVLAGSRFRDEEDGTPRRRARESAREGAAGAPAAGRAGADRHASIARVDIRVGDGVDAVERARAWLCASKRRQLCKGVES